MDRYRLPKPVLKQIKKLKATPCGVLVRNEAGALIAITEDGKLYENLG